MASVAQSPLVSVIIPAFNSARWIGSALESVQAQDYPALEIIVADNGSTDGSRDVVHRVAPSARLVSAERRCPAAARNAALEAVRGAYVQFLDSDDFLAPDKIGRQVAALERSTADVAWSDFAEVGAMSSPRHVDVRRARHPKLEGDIASALVGEEGFLQLGAALFRRSDIIAPIRFDETFSVVEDVRYLLTLAVAGATFLHVPGRGFYWRQHDAPSRASNVDSGDFYMACVANADLLLSGDRDAPVTSVRQSAAVRVWLAAAEVLAERRDPRLSQVLARLNACDSNWHTRVRPPHRYLIPVLGFQRTFDLSVAVKSATRGIRPVSRARRT